jgi:DNA-binding sugar fermentation-stimulating protein
MEIFFKPGDRVVIKEENVKKFSDAAGLKFKNYPKKIINVNEQKTKILIELDQNNKKIVNIKNYRLATEKEMMEFRLKEIFIKKTFIEVK